LDVTRRGLELHTAVRVIKDAGSRGRRQVVDGGAQCLARDLPFVSVTAARSGLLHRLAHVHHELQYRGKILALGGPAGARSVLDVVDFLRRQIAGPAVVVTTEHARWRHVRIPQVRLIAAAWTVVAITPVIAVTRPARHRPLPH
jgi:hypothetical protein